MMDCRGVLRAASNIYEEPFLQNKLLTKKAIYNKKKFIIDVCQSPKYALESMNPNFEIESLFLSSPFDICQGSE